MRFVADGRIEELEGLKARLISDLLALGDLRRGSISINYRRCGKTACHCSRDAHPGHGPQYLLVKKENGRSRSLNLKPGRQLRQVEAEVENYRHFRSLVAQVVEISEEICQLRFSKPSRSIATFPKTTTAPPPPRGISPARQV